MNKEIITPPQSQRRLAFMLLTILFVGWALIGVWPLSCYETDSMHIIAGCNNYISGSGNLIHPNYSYAYDMQPLVTILVVSVKMVFSFLTCEQIYCLLTAIAAFFFAYGCFTVVCNVTQLKQEYHSPLPAPCSSSPQAKRWAIPHARKASNSSNN